MAVSWINHPKYVRVRERLIESLTSEHYRFRRSEAVVFLCGGQKSVPRDDLADYLKRRNPEIRLFYAEVVWELLASKLPLGALKLESELAALADLVIIIVESPGTFAELGAFSNSESLRKKLLPIIDNKYEPPQESFLALGPIKWIEAESNFAPPVYVSLEGILAGVGEIQERISRIPRTTAHVSSLADKSKHLLLFICDLVAVIHPATFEMVDFYCKRILQSPPSGENVATLMALARAMDLLHSKVIDDIQYFSPALADATTKPFHHVRLVGLPALRTEHASALMSIPMARDIADRLRSSK